MEEANSAEEAAKLLQRREAGILPVIDILGTEFIVDWRLRELRERNAPWNTIKIDTLEWDEQVEGYFLLYDKEEHISVELQDFIFADPNDLVDIVIPHEIRLDPYAVAREHEIDTLKFLKQNPIDPNLKAELYGDRKKKIEELKRNSYIDNSSVVQPEPPGQNKSRGR